jgi:predicted transport protein
VAHPFLLELYSDWQKGSLSRDEFLNLVRLTESYVLRRFLCGIPTNSMNKTFASLAKGIDRTRYHRSAQAEFLKLAGYRKFPGDAEVVQMLADRDVYNTPRCAFLLERLENSYHPKEPVKAATFTIEHVMPQTLSEEWKDALGEKAEAVHQRHLHTLGNLTLTGYNSELSCKPFKTKLEMAEGGFLSSPLALNTFIRQQVAWGEKEICVRGQTLATRVCGLWPAPEASALAEFVEPEAVAASAYTLDSYPQLSGSVRQLYDLLEERILALHPGARRECRKLYVAFKLDTNFVDVIPQLSKLLLVINLRFDQIDDPKGWCRDITGLGRWGNGDVEVALTGPSQLDYVAGLIEQSLSVQVQE